MYGLINNIFKGTQLFAKIAKFYEFSIPQNLLDESLISLLGFQSNTLNISCAKNGNPGTLGKQK